MTQLKSDFELAQLADRFGHFLNKVANHANTILVGDRCDDSDIQFHRDAWHQGNYCRIQIIDRMNKVFSDVKEARIQIIGNLWLLILLNKYCLHVSRFPHEKSIELLKSPLREPVTIRRARQEKSTYKMSPNLSFMQLALNSFEVKPITTHIDPPICDYRHIGLYYEKIKGLVVAWHLVEQDETSILGKASMEVVGTVPIAESQNLPPTPMLKRRYNESEDDSQKLKNDAS